MKQRRILFHLAGESCPDLCLQPSREENGLGFAKVELRQQLLDHAPMHIGEPVIPSGMTIGESRVIEAELV